MKITKINKVQLDHCVKLQVKESLVKSGSGGLPDIDYDVPSNKRQNIVEYLVSKYGREQIAFIGTAQNFKLKSLIKDLVKLKGANFSYANLISSIIPKEHGNSKMQGLFELVIEEDKRTKGENKLKEAINKYPMQIELIDNLIFQPRSFGIHAAAVVIVPKYNAIGERVYIWDYVPVRMVDGYYVTEWEKDAVEDMGLLKEDLLGLTQLDKFMRMDELIRQYGEEPPTFDESSKLDQSVLDLFRQGYTEDVFQFNTELLKSYCLDLQPDTLEDLFAANSLCRPGAMSTGAHNKFVNRKHGVEEYVYPTALENILNSTYGLFVYQEQVISAFKLITNCSSDDAENFRKTISKFKAGKFDDKIAKYEKIFKESYNKLTNEEEVNDVWEQIISFVSYSFNLSHAACYSVTGYRSQYYKKYFPLEFYTTALEFADKESVRSTIIQEIKERNEIHLMPPEINKSSFQYTLDKKLKNIYWSLNSIKYVSSKAINSISLIRNESNFFSFEEFMARIKEVKGSGINVRVIANLILTGCFDEVENCETPKDRYKVWKKFSSELPEGFDKKYIDQDWVWVLRQNELCGYGSIDFQSIYKQTELNKKIVFCDYNKLNGEDSKKMEGRCVGIGGILMSIKTNSTKKGEMARLEINQNNNIINVTLWNDQWIIFKEILENAKNRIVLLTGDVKHDSWRNRNVIYMHSGSRLEVL